MANPPNGGGTCKQDIDCTKVGFPFCNTDKGTCAPCFAPAGKNHCPSTAPHCDVDSCTACVDDTDCPNSVCMLDGSCADPASVIHVLVNGQDPPCGGAGAGNACKLDAALMLAASDGTKNVIKLDDTGTYMSGMMNNFVVNANVTIDLHGATLNRHVDGPPIVTIGAGVTLLGGTIQGAHGSMGSAIACTDAKLNVDRMLLTVSDQFGIDASGCTLAVTRARIENNASTGIRVVGGSITLVNAWLDNNAGGGVDVGMGAQFVIVGNVLLNNGTTASQIGGISILTSASNNRLEFNSIAENKALASAAAGIACTANYTAKNNIIWSNNSFVATNAGIQVSGSCGYSYSDIGPAGITGTIDMGNNQKIDPKFKDEMADLHLTSASPLQMLQQSDPASSLTDIAAKDIDGEPRVAPAYIGADQYYPPRP
jgi:hypothetical protein